MVGPTLLWVSVCKVVFGFCVSSVRGLSLGLGLSSGGGEVSLCAPDLGECFILRIPRLC